MKSHRLARMSEVIREVAASTILFEIRDPKVKGITVTRAETAADLQHAKVYVSVMGTEGEQRRAVLALQNAAGFIQSRLADRMTSRFLPTLTFVLDEGVKKSLEISRILAEERAKGGLGPADEGDEADEALAGDADEGGGGGERPPEVPAAPK